MNVKNKLLFVCGGPAGEIYSTTFWKQFFRLFSVGGLLVNKQFILHKTAQLKNRMDLDLLR
jgi:predicted methyltransferase